MSNSPKIVIFDEGEISIHKGKMIKQIYKELFIYKNKQNKSMVVCLSTIQYTCLITSFKYGYCIFNHFS
jgi:hypothetical protein